MNFKDDVLEVGDEAHLPLEHDLILDYLNGILVHVWVIDVHLVLVCFLLTHSNNSVSKSHALLLFKGV